MSELEQEVSPTGIWSQTLASEHHIFDYYLAQWIGQKLDKTIPVTDFGCGRASYIRYLHDIGFTDLFGVEGEQLNNFEFSKIKKADLTKHLDMGRKGNVICLEVGEHIPANYTQQFLDNILRPLGVGNKIILSWGAIGQSGIGHVNCQHNVWVINEMEKRGLKCNYEDSLQARSVIGNHTSWFRNTILIFEKL